MKIELEQKRSQKKGERKRNKLLYSKNNFIRMNDGIWFNEKEEEITLALEALNSVFLFISLLLLCFNLSWKNEFDNLQLSACQSCQKQELKSQAF